MSHRPAALALGLALLALPGRALAWVDAHVAGDDVRLEVDKDGAARIEHKLTLRISGGPLRSIDLRGVDPDAVPEPDGYVVPSRDAATNSLANASPISAELLPPPTKHEDGQPALSALRVRFEAEKGLKSGVFVVFVRYRTELARRGLLARDGSMARLRWTGLTWEDGFDNARATFAFPTGPTAPRPEEAQSADPNDPAATPPASVLSTLRRATGRDELELLRPYAPKGEPITWNVRFDARALEVTAPKTSQTITLPGSTETSPLTPSRRGWLILGGGILFVLYGLLVAAKSRQVERAARAAGTMPRPLIPAPPLVRAAGAAAALVGGIGLSLALPTGTAGALLVALAAALSAHRTPRWTPALRGPGTWLPIAETEAFAKPPRPTGASLDVSTGTGKWLLLLSLAALGGVVAFVARHSAYHAHLLAYDAVALLAIFCTGRLAELPPDPAVAAAPFLRDVAKRLRKAFRKNPDDLRLSPRIRVPEGNAKPDELRLGVVPRGTLPGFLGLEVGVVLAPAAGKPLTLPQVLVRVAAGSACEGALLSLAPGASASRGRKPNERVLAFSPRLPTTWATAALVTRLLGVLRAEARSETSGIRKKREALAERAA
jgi:hypothetical protein